MSFVWVADKPLMTREQIAREVHAVSLRGPDELATVIALMTISTEVGHNDSNGQRQWWRRWNPADPQTTNIQLDYECDVGLSLDYFQEQVSRPDALGKARGWGGQFGKHESSRKRTTHADSATTREAP